MAVQTGLCLVWSETPEGTFCRVVVHFINTSRFEDDDVKVTMCVLVLVTLLSINSNVVLNLFFQGGLFDVESPQNDGSASAMLHVSIKT